MMLRHCAPIVGAFVLLAVPSTATGHLTTRSSSTKIEVGDSGSNSAYPGCRDGEAVSGGFSNPDFNPRTSKLFLFGLNPAPPLPGGPSWRATAANLGTVAGADGTLRTFAYCAGRRPRLILREATTTVKGSDKGSATAHCPSGSEAVSGGFSIVRQAHAYYPYTQLFGFRSERVRSRAWRASAYNMKESGKVRFAVLVQCDPREPGLVTRSSRVRVPAGGAEKARARCPNNRTAISGGFAGRARGMGGSGSFPYSFKRATRHAWSAAAFGEREPAPFKVFAYCKRRG
jgi:hypothetical protein